MSANSTSYRPGREHPRFRSGITIHRGYRRIKAGPLRDKLEHRAVLEKLLAEQGRAWPQRFETHHQDFRKTHNCPGNLILLEGVIHRAISVGHMNLAKRLRARAAFDALREVGL